MRKKSSGPKATKYNRGKVYTVSVLIVTLLLVGFFLYAHLLKDKSVELESSSYAAPRGVVANASPVIIEGEDISTYSLTGGLQVIDDQDAAGSKALMLSINTTANTQVSLPESTARLTVMAKGDRCKGNPHVTIMVDEKTVLNKNVPATTWNDYTVNAPMAAGTHNVSIAFTNDLSSGTCDRNLKIDQLIFQ
jgi:hypothetical protein